MVKYLLLANISLAEDIYMAQITSGDPHGLNRIFVGLVDNEGYNLGTLTARPADGTLMTPYQILYPKDAMPALPDRSVIDFTGGNVWTGSYMYGITSIGSFNMNIATIEAELIAMLTNTEVDQTTNTRSTMFAENILLPTPNQAWLMIVYNIQSKEDGSVGANKYIHTIIPRAWISPKGTNGAPSFQSPGSADYTVAMTVADRTPFGLLFSDTTMNLEGNRTPFYHDIRDNQLHIVTFTAAAGATEVVTLPYKPVAYDYSTPDSNDDPVSCFVNGEIVNATTVNATTGAVTLTNAGGGAFSGGEIIGIIYETNYVPV
jgi:hypothetical protein